MLAVNAKYVHSSLSVMVLAGGIAKYAKAFHETIVIEATINHQKAETVASVASYRPDVVGISTYIWNADWIEDALGLLREALPGALFVLGGPEASFNAEYWMARGADYVLPGEGEFSLPPLLDMLDEATLTIKSGGEAAYPPLCPNTAPAQSICTGAKPEAPQPLHNNEPIHPYIGISDEHLAAMLNGRIAYLETSRGCPFQCAFCLSGGSGVSFFPLDTAKEQVYKLSKSGSQTIKFVDRTFNCDAARAFELIEYIIGLDTKCCFHFEVAADLFDERTLSLIARAPPGRIQLEAGLQSFFAPALQATSRHMDLDKAERNIAAILSGRNVHLHVDLIAGLPYETLCDFQNSFDRAYSLGVHTLQLGFLKLLHGSELRRRAEALGICYGARPPYEIMRSPWLSPEDIAILKQAENALQHTYNKSRFLSTLEYVLEASGARPFLLFSSLGAYAPNRGEHLADYAAQIYSFCVRLPGVDEGTLRDRMTCDWLCMVKGANMPSFLPVPYSRRKLAAEKAKQRLGRSAGRAETAVLGSGKGVVVDVNDRDPVTGLYRIHFFELD